MKVRPPQPSAGKCRQPGIERGAPSSDSISDFGQKANPENTSQQESHSTGNATQTGAFYTVSSPADNNIIADANQNINPESSVGAAPAGFADPESVHPLKLCSPTKSNFSVDILATVCYHADKQGARRLANPPKGGEHMPITLTIHIFGCVITIKVKKQNRHPAR